MTISIKRIECSKDEKGRHTCLLTTVTHLNNNNPEIDDILFDLVDKEYEEDGDNIDYDETVGESGHELQVTGKFIVTFLNALKEKGLIFSVEGVFDEDKNPEDFYYDVEVY